MDTKFALMQMDRVDQIDMSFGVFWGSEPKDPREWVSKPMRGAVMIADYSRHLHDQGFRQDEPIAEIETWGSLETRKIYPPKPPEPLREWEFEVIRTCECGHTWGQT